MRLASLLVAASAMSAACAEEPVSQLPANFAACEVAAEPQPPAAPTYFEHVKPILDARCGGCHVEGGLGPFALTTYDEVAPGAEVIAEEVVARRMPPWPPDDCCAEYRWKRSLTADQIATIQQWALTGAAMGDPADEGPAIDPDDSELARIDATITMPEPYAPVPVIGVDDVRCFLLDWPFDDQKYVTGLAVRPGNRQLVHHVILSSVDEDEVGALEALDAEDAPAGWPCVGFGMANEVQPTGHLGGWTPGARAVTYPGGMGRKVPPGSRVMMQVHYDGSHGVDFPDQTSIDFMVEDSVQRVARNIGVGNPIWLLEGGMRIEADDPDAMVWFAFDPTVLLTKDEPFLIWNVNLHMHELGSRGTVAIFREDGTKECLLDIDAWEFAWLGDYYFAEPVPFHPGDQLYVECHWDNTAANQKIVNGEQQTPRDLEWGTDEEMCGGIMVITEGLE